MIKPRDRALYMAAELTFGRDVQLVVANEELAEAQQQICKVMRGKMDINSLAEELADAVIVIEEVMVMLNISERDLLKVKTRKQHRLIKTIAEAQKTNADEVMAWINALKNI